jgi:ligand-binding sensor domain-containing protein
MKNRHYFPQVSLLICILCCFPHLIHAYSLRQFSNKNGLSNSAILSLYQDHQGVIWIGSCDGLNIFDGTNIHVYNPANPTKASLSGNLINDIMETEKEVLWIQTNYGLDRLDTKHQTSKSFTEFKDKNYMAKSRDNDLFIVKDDGYIYYYQPEKQLFQKLEVPQIAFGHVLSTIIDENNILWIFTSDNDTRSYQINKNKEGITLTPTIFSSTPNSYYGHSQKKIWSISSIRLTHSMNMTSAINSNTLLQISKQKSKLAEKFLPSSNNKTTITLASKAAD